MKLGKHHCTEIVLRFVTERENFANKRFFSDPRLSKHAQDWEKGTPLEFLHYTKNPKTSDYHIHTRVDLEGSDVRLFMKWVRPTAKTTRKSAYPYAEDAVTWIRRFFRSNIYAIRCSADFQFPRSRFASKLGIPAPLWDETGTTGQVIRGIRVGVELVGAKDASVVTDVFDNELLVIAMAAFRTKLSQVKPEVLLAKFSRLVKGFVREK